VISLVTMILNAWTLTVVTQNVRRSLNARPKSSIQTNNIRLLFGWFSLSRLFG